MAFSGFGAGSGALSGAASGSVFGPIGAGVGALIGGITGGFGGGGGGRAAAAMEHRILDAQGRLTPAYQAYLKYLQPYQQFGEQNFSALQGMMGMGGAMPTSPYTAMSKQELDDMRRMLTYRLSGTGGGGSTGGEQWYADELSRLRMGQSARDLGFYSGFAQQYGLGTGSQMGALNVDLAKAMGEYDIMRGEAESGGQMARSSERQGQLSNLGGALGNLGFMAGYGGFGGGAGATITPPDTAFEMRMNPENFIGTYGERGVGLDLGWMPQIGGR